MVFILFYVNLSICENKLIARNMREQVEIVPYNHLIKKLNICNIQKVKNATFNEEFDVFNRV